MRFWWKNNKSKPSLFFTLEYKNAMDFVNMALDAKQSIEDKIIVLDFVLNVVKEDLRTDLLSRIIYSQNTNATDFRYPFPLAYINGEGQEQLLPEEGIIEIDLAQDYILVLPWDKRKLQNQLLNIFHTEFIFDKSNHMAYCFPYIELCYLFNGRHSAVSGIIHKKGIIAAKRYDLTKLFPHIHTDGKHWYNSHTDKSTREVVDFRLAIMYEVARIKYTLENM